MSAAILLKALATRHSGDVFVPECKNGPTQTGSHRRMDAWVLLKTWSPVTTIGYELKVSRADWRRDAKLDEYSGLVHLLYIVAPKGVVPADEIPQGIGLIEMSETGARLVTRRKAERREIDMPVSLLVYVLMCRVQVQNERGVTGEERPPGQWRVDALREWAQKKDERRNLHYAVSSKIQDQFHAQEHEIDRLTKRLSEMERIERRIGELGFDASQPVTSWQAEQRIAAIAKVIDMHLIRSLDRTLTELQHARTQLDELRRGVIDEEVPA